MFGLDESLGLLEVQVSLLVHSLTQVNVRGFNVDFLLFLELNKAGIRERSRIEDFAQYHWMFGVYAQFFLPIKQKGSLVNGLQFRLYLGLESQERVLLFVLRVRFC